jgi:hypothetical protein
MNLTVHLKLTGESLTKATRPWHKSVERAAKLCFTTSDNISKIRCSQSQMAQ